MRVNGTKADDLARLGVLTRQRYQIPLWVSVSWAVTKWTARTPARLVAWSVRAWTLTLPALALAVVWARSGRLAALAVVVAGLVALVVWWRR